MLRGTAFIAALAIAGGACAQTSDVVLNPTPQPTSGTPNYIFVPVGGYFAIRVTGGTVTISSSYEQGVG